MKLAWWPHTRDLRIASARLRSRRIVDQLRCNGVDAGLYRPGDAAPRVLVLSKRYDERSVSHAIGLRAGAHTRIALDLCDNHFHSDVADDASQRRRAALLHAIDNVDLMICATAELARVVASQPLDRLPPIRVIGDAVEPPSTPARPGRLAHPRAEWALAQLRRRLARDGIPGGRRLVWFGNHGSPNVEGGMSDLLRVRALFEELARERPLSLTVISNDAEKFARLIEPWSVPAHYLEWHAATFSRALQLHDIAVIPVGRNPFTLCKTNNRMATALLHGLAVVADSIPAYVPFAEAAVLDDWPGGLRRLMADPELRRLQARKGRQQVEAGARLEHIASEWAQALEPLSR